MSYIMFRIKTEEHVREIRSSDVKKCIKMPAASGIGCMLLEDLFGVKFFFNVSGNTHHYALDRNEKERYDLDGKTSLVGWMRLCLADVEE